MSDASVSCKVGARYWTLVVFANLFYMLMHGCQTAALAPTPAVSTGGSKVNTKMDVASYLLLAVQDVASYLLLAVQGK